MRTAALPHCQKARTLSPTLPESRKQPPALPHTAWIKMPHTAHRTLTRTAHSRTLQSTWIQIVACGCIKCINMNLCEFMWIYVNLYELTWTFTWFNLILSYSIWFIPNLYEIIQINVEFIWIYLKMCTLPHTAAYCRVHCWTAAHCHTKPRTLPQPAKCIAAHIHALPHTAALPESCTLPRALPEATHCSTHCSTHCLTVAHSCTAAHCMD
jgi:hypothetical protein